MNNNNDTFRKATERKDAGVLASKKVAAMQSEKDKENDGANQLLFAHKLPVIAESVRTSKKRNLNQFNQQQRQLDIKLKPADSSDQVQQENTNAQAYSVPISKVKNEKIGLKRLKLGSDFIGQRSAAILENPFELRNEIKLNFKQSSNKEDVVRQPQVDSINRLPRISEASPCHSETEKISKSLAKLSLKKSNSQLFQAHFRNEEGDSISMIQQRDQQSQFGDMFQDFEAKGTSVFDLQFN